jgi:hypothetical protein
MISGDRKLFLFVALGFALLLGAWATLFTIASRNRMADVPLAHKTPPAQPPNAP